MQLPRRTERCHEVHDERVRQTCGVRRNDRRLSWVLTVYAIHMKKERTAIRVKKFPARLRASSASAKANSGVVSIE